MDVLKDWLVTFGMIIIKPLPQTFLMESEKAKGKFTSAFIWLVFVVILMNIHVFLVRKTFLIPAFLFTILFLPIVFLFFVFCIHMLYKRLFKRKKDYYTQLLYLIVGIFVPFTIIYVCFAQIPVVGEVLFWTTLIYTLILTVVAVTAVTKLKIWQSIAVVLLGSVLAIDGFFCIPAFIFSIMQTVPRVF
jgi:hypothetical protein